jgi:hypothetical protein
MIDYKFIEYDYKKLNPGGIVNLLYKVYPSGTKWPVGYYRTRCEAEIEINYLNSAEKENYPITYEVEQVSDYKLDVHIHDRAKEKRDEFERYRAYHLAEEKRKQEQEKSYMKWRNEVLKPWLEKNPGKTEHDMPLNMRLFPSLF